MNDEISPLAQKIKLLQVQYEQLSAKYGVLFKTPHSNMTILQVFDLVADNNDLWLSEISFIKMPQSDIGVPDRPVITGSKRAK